MTNESLLSRLQALTGPSREIDAEIALELGYEVSESVGADGPLLRHPGELLWNSVPRYTASVDAALTLVPEGAQWEVGNGPEGFMATIYVDTGNDIAVIEWFGAPTPAIALLIAILKAKEESKP